MGVQIQVRVGTGLDVKMSPGETRWFVESRGPGYIMQRHCDNDMLRCHPYRESDYS